MRPSSIKFFLLFILAELLTSNIQAQISFESHDQYNIGDSPYALKAGDFNNDGFMDMVSGNFTNTANERISVIMNNKIGGFNVTNLSAPQTVIDVDTADFNNDGNLDFVAAIASGDAVSIYMGNGDGTFTQSDLVAGDLPNDIATGDFNNDNNPDIAVINRTSDDLYIYLGDGSGGMGTPQIIAVVNLDDHITLGDFDNDNNLDILTGNSSTSAGTVDFYAGDGAGNFAAKVPTSGFVYKFDFMSSIDINKDGNLDLVANTSSTPYISLGVGDGTFAAPTFLGQGGGVSVVADFDNDGNLDLLSRRNFKAFYYPGDGSGAFPEHRRIPTDVGGFGMTAGDWDNDGNLDFAMAGGGTIDAATVIYGKGNGYFYAPTEYPTPNNPRGLTMGDFNGDGIEDLALCAYGTNNNNLYIYLGQANGTFANTSIFDAGILPEDIEALDINADGKIDLAVLDLNASAKTVNFFTGDGAGTFTPAGNLAVTASFTLLVDDVNKDNITDLILAGNTGNNVQIYKGNGDATFSLLIDLDVGEPVRNVIVADINEDTNPDLAILANPAIGLRQIRFYQGDGIGGFTPAGTNLDLPGGGSTFTKEDFNNDGHIDFLSLGSDGDMYVGDGTFSFSYSSTNTGVSLVEHSTEVKDIDGDGIKDLISGSQCNICSSGGPLQINVGNGDGTFSAAFWSRSRVGGYRIIVSDFNNDGKNDIASLVNNSTFDGLSILLNTTPCSSGAPIPDVTNLPDLTNECSIAMPTAPTATSSCAGSITGTSNVPFPITSTITVTWTYDDGDGNTSTQNQNVIINDATMPVADMASLADLTDECSVAAPIAPTATDNCAGSIPGTPDATFPITTTTTVIWTYDDGNGNTSTQNQNVIINDSTVPVADIASLGDLTDECSVAAPTAPTATDNCLGSLTGTPDITFPVSVQGTTTVIWTYDDGNGNTSTQTQNVIIDDTTAPVADIASLVDLTDACSVATPTAPTATDNCAGSIAGTPDVTFPITTQGSTTITWAYDDGNGNTSTQTQDVIITPIDNTVSQNGSTLTANADGFTYQWIDCANSSTPISGETSQSFTTNTSGSYAVEIDNGSCMVTSNCIDISINVLGTSGLKSESEISVYPNPVQGVVNINLLNIQVVIIKLLSLDGRLMKDFGTRSGESIQLEINNLKSGIYILQVENGERIGQRKIVKK